MVRAAVVARRRDYAEANGLRFVEQLPGLGGRWNFGPFAPGFRVVPFGDADHSFHVPAKSGQTDAEVFERLLDATANWIGGHLP